MFCVFLIIFGRWIVLGCRLEVGGIRFLVVLGCVVFRSVLLLVGFGFFDELLFVMV